VKSDSEAEMDDLSDTSVECERREDRTKTNSMVQLMSHIQVNTKRQQCIENINITNESKNVCAFAD
jgi:hypothetical protein